jgi:hypothetical protein
MQGTSIMEAVAFGGKDASDSISGTVIIYVLIIYVNIFKFKIIKDWSNLQFSNVRVDNSNRVSMI